jgi:hypothetical protein
VGGVRCARNVRVAGKAFATKVGDAQRTDTDFGCGSLVFSMPYSNDRVCRLRESRHYVLAQLDT